MPKHKGKHSHRSHGYYQEDNAMSSAYKFLSNPELIKFILKTKVMFIMRGLSGSGKSTVATAIKDRFKHTRIFSTDDFFYQGDGIYQFDRMLLGEYHKRNQDRTREACSHNIRPIVIDNTNVKRWEMESYYNIAMQYDYIPIVVSPQTPWAQDPKFLATRNKHAVEEQMMFTRLKDLQSTYPTFYGWFFNSETSNELKDMARDYFDACRDNIPNFLKLIGKSSGKTMQDFYNKDGVVHCTSCFIGSNPTEDALNYMNSSVVQDTWLDMFNLRIVGLIITPRTVGARVELTHKQMSLWNNDQSDDPCPRALAREERSQPFLLSPPFRPFLGPFHSQCEENFTPMARKPAPKAHITLGCAPDVIAVQTGPDLLMLTAMESKYKRFDDRFYELPPHGILGNGTLVRFYGPENGFVIYFDQPFQKKSVFNHRY